MRIIPKQAARACVGPTRTTLHPPYLGYLALLAVPLLAMCSPGADPSKVKEPAWEEGGAGTGKGLTVSSDKVHDALDDAPRASNGLPLWESRPGAKVALFLDFDGGTYDGKRYRGVDRDGNRSRFGHEERFNIIKAALEVAEAYKGFNVNVTTDYEAMKDARKWGSILITDDEGTSGEAWVDVIDSSTSCSDSSCEAMGYAGSEAVFEAPSSQRGYLLIHELGHQFGLNHSGKYVKGKFYEWSELEESRTGDWLGGRNSYFSRYTWLTSQTEYSEDWQDPVAIIGDVAGTTSNRQRR